MQSKSERLGTMPIGKLLVSMSVPMMISFFIQAMYNIVDSMFVARISEDALTAVSIAFPVQQIIVALGTGTGVAATALVPRFTGQGKPELARRIANNCVFLSCCYTLFFLLFGLTAVRPFYQLQTDHQAILEAGYDYLSIVCCVSVGAFFGQNFEKLLIATGNSLQSMIAQGTGAVFNLIFDPLLIFGIGPFPQLGVRGAAIATVLGQIVAACVAFVMLTLREKTIRLRLKDCLPRLELLKQIFTVAIPSAITVGLTSVMSFGMNQILLGFSTTATAVFGIWLKLQNFSCMPIFGLNNGTVPILSYNYGARQLDRVRAAYRLALKVALILMAVLTVIYECIPGVLLGLFSASDNMLSMGTVAIRLCVLSLLPAAFCLIHSSAFQALNHNHYTLMISLFRQVLFVLPLAFLLSLAGNLDLVWIAIPGAELLSAVVTVFLRKKAFASVGLE